MRMVLLTLIVLLQTTLAPATSGREEVIAQIIAQAQESLHAQYDSEAFRFEITPRWLPNQLLQTSPEHIIAVEALGTRVRGISNFRVHVHQGQRIAQTDVQLFVRVEQFLPVLREQKLSSQPLQPNELYLSWTDITMERDELVSNPEAVAGTVLRRNVGANEPIRVRDVRSGTIIEAGTPVTIHFNGEGLVVALTGVARQTGETGEIIRVYSDATRKTYLAEITGNGEVLWKQTL
jgi:flagella basal body P-ring formation protein FlgA